MSAPEKPCGKCIYYRRSKKGLVLKKRTPQLELVEFEPSKPPQWFGACIKHNWFVSANMSGCEDWETADNLSMQWNNRDDENEG